MHTVQEHSHPPYPLPPPLGLPSSPPGSPDGKPASAAPAALLWHCPAPQVTQRSAQERQRVSAIPGKFGPQEKDLTPLRPEGPLRHQLVPRPAQAGRRPRGQSWVGFLLTPRQHLLGALPPAPATGRGGHSQDRLSQLTPRAGAYAQSGLLQAAWRQAGDKTVVPFLVIAGEEIKMPPITTC